MKPDDWVNDPIIEEPQTAKQFLIEVAAVFVFSALFIAAAIVFCA